MRLNQPSSLTDWKKYWLNWHIIPITYKILARQINMSFAPHVLVGFNGHPYDLTSLFLLGLLGRTGRLQPVPAILLLARRVPCCFEGSRVTQSRKALWWRKSFAINVLLQLMVVQLFSRISCQHGIVRKCLYGRHICRLLCMLKEP